MKLITPFYIPGSSHLSKSLNVIETKPVRVFPWHSCRVKETISVLHSTVSLKIWQTLMLPREKAMAPHSSPLAWKIPWTEEPGRLQSMGSHRVGHDWSDLAAGYRFILRFSDVSLTHHPLLGTGLNTSNVSAKQQKWSLLSGSLDFNCREGDQNKTEANRQHFWKL